MLSLFLQVTSIRNKKLFHSKDFTVEDDDLDEYITDMMNLLQSGELANDSSAQEAVRDLQKVSIYICTYMYTMYTNSYYVYPHECTLNSNCAFCSHHNQLGYIFAYVMIYIYIYIIYIYNIYIYIYNIYIYI